MPLYWLVIPAWRLDVTHTYVTRCTLDKSITLTPIMDFVDPELIKVKTPAYYGLSRESRLPDSEDKPQRLQGLLPQEAYCKVSSLESRPQYFNSRASKAGLFILIHEPGYNIFS